MPTTEIFLPIKQYYEDVEIGESIPELVKEPMSLNRLVRYSGASGDFNPLHTDPQIGELIGTGGIIAHGMLIMGFTGQFISDYIGPQALRKFNVRFRGMTHLDDIITCSGSITKKYKLDSEQRIVGKFQAADQNGEVKVSGTFEAVLPSKS